jgi:hypothetical protein
MERKENPNVPNIQTEYKSTAPSCKEFPEFAILKNKFRTQVSF